MKLFAKLAVLGFLMSISTSRIQAQETAKIAVSEPFFLWPGTAPGEKGDIGEEKDTTPPDPKTPPEKYVMRIGNVTKPTITVFRPAPEKDTGAAVVVCPGGGYNILAY